MSMIEMKVEGIGIDENKNTLVLLRDMEEQRFLPIWIGPAEAVSIAMELEHREPPRPMTHDLMANMLREIGAELKHVVVSDYRDRTFYATITLQVGNAIQEIDARPSDAIALALRSNASIFVTEKVADHAAIRVEDADTDKTKTASSEEIQRFMKLLEGVDLGSDE